ncbi:MAG: hypothetical protein GTN89_13430 [Acidobacteria bacterium]|nr:hypothetical protein [Acidobacteriota bacterium]NIM60249.1 hypothetical protein [Acidobacteriota bacterium]NIO60287.1 hypothetical protein [Acidobacteriota bacterium]NIQ31342.1 hypothetical protein [Acidobacteriota bacterium]NIQ86565.1 hypothetical protein [Acidobacteriota bacterium]
MRRFLALSVVLVLLAGSVASAASKQSRIDRQASRYDASPAGFATIQIEASIEGQLWLFVGHRGGDAFWLQAIPLLSADITNGLRSIYDGPDPTSGYYDKVDPDDDDDDYDTFDDGLVSGNGIPIRPKTGPDSSDDE